MPAWTDTTDRKIEATLLCLRSTAELIVANRELRPYNDTVIKHAKEAERQLDLAMRAHNQNGGNNGNGDRSSQH